jgi:hypothetical protein
MSAEAGHAEDVGELTLVDLPTEVLSYILQFVHSIHDLNTLELVCGTMLNAVRFHISKTLKIISEHGVDEAKTRSELTRKFGYSQPVLISAHWIIRGISITVFRAISQHAMLKVQNLPYVEEFSYDQKNEKIDITLDLEKYGIPLHTDQYGKNALSNIFEEFESRVAYMRMSGTQIPLSRLRLTRIRCRIHSSYAFLPLTKAPRVTVFLYNDDDRYCWPTIPGYTVSDPSVTDTDTVYCDRVDDETTNTIIQYLRPLGTFVIDMAYGSYFTDTETRAHKFLSNFINQQHDKDKFPVTEIPHTCKLTPCEKCIYLHSVLYDGYCYQCLCPVTYCDICFKESVISLFIGEHVFGLNETSIAKRCAQCISKHGLLTEPSVGIQLWLSCNALRLAAATKWRKWFEDWRKTRNGDHSCD